MLQASYTRMEESQRGVPSVGIPPPPPPPPPSALVSGRKTPVLQPGCRPTTSLSEAIHRYSTASSAHSAQPTVDSATLQYGSANLRQGSDNQPIRGYQSYISDARVVRSTIPSPGGDGQHRPVPSQLGFSPTRGEVPAPTVDTDLALSLVNETRPSYEMKTAGKVPLSEPHLLSLVKDSELHPPVLHQPSTQTPYKPQPHPVTITKREQITSTVRTPVHAPLSVETQYLTPVKGSRSPYGSRSSGGRSPAEFDPNALCSELRESQLEAKSPRSPHKPLSSFSPRQLSAYRAAPAQILPIYAQPKDDVDSLTNRLMYNMETGEGAAGDYNCAKCGEGISAEKPGCTALSQTFHLDCFVCSVCGNRLAGGSFYAVEGKPYCEADYINTLDKCTVCAKAIMDRILRASGKTFHPQCFVCSACGKCLDAVPFTVDSNNQVHCVDCFHEKYAPRCAICEKPIIPEEGSDDSLRVVAMDKSFHVKCYKCEDCELKLSSKIEGHGCYPLDDHLLCKSCNAERVRKLTANV